MDIDLVYTWVNPLDDSLNAKRDAARRDQEGTVDLEYRAGVSRTRDRGELLYSLGASRRYLPFVRNTYVICAGVAPLWLTKMSHVTVVAQKDLIPEAFWPTYQSDLVEAFIYRIPGLSENYIYSNDDFFFAQPHEPSDFFIGEQCKISTSRLATAGNLEEGTYKEMEKNSVRALQSKLKLPRFKSPRPENTHQIADLALSIARAKKNGFRLLDTFAHVAQPYLKSRWADFHAVFRNEITTLANFPFRSRQGFAVNFMYLHYLNSLGDACLYRDDRHYFIDPRSSFERRRSLLEAVRHHHPSVTRFCINDCPAPGSVNPQDEASWIVYIRELMLAVAGAPE